MTSEDQGWPLGHIWEAGGERFNANVGFPKSSHQIKLKLPSDQTKAVELIFALPPLIRYAALFLLIATTASKTEADNVRG